MLDPRQSPQTRTPAIRTRCAPLARRRAAATLVAAIVAVGIVGCGPEVSRKVTPRPSTPPPAAPCSLLTAREASAVFKLRVRVRRSATFCTYQGTKNHVFHSVIVTPQQVRIAPPTSFATRDGPIVAIRGHGYHGQAQSAGLSAAGGGLQQAKAQVMSGDVIVRVFVTARTNGLHAQQQLAPTVALSHLVGHHLARAAG
jgi:hypothetical protein